MFKLIFKKVFLIPLLALFLLILSMPIQPCSPAYAQEAEAEYWAVIVGISDYEYIDDTRYGRDDAQALYERFAPIWGEDHIRLLVDSQATKANIQDALCNWLDPREEADDVVLFYFTGHGCDDYGDYICPYDSLTYSYANDIRDYELDSWLDTLESEGVVVILDTCFSGGFIPELSASDLVILAASGADESSWECSALGHGVFTYYLLQAFDDLTPVDTNGDYAISAEEYFYYVEPKVVAYTQDFSSVQHPQLYDGYAGELILFTTFSVTFDASPDVISLTIDGTTYSPGELPMSFSWATGSEHVCVAPSVESGGTGTRYAFTSWSPDGDTSPSRTISVEGVYIASYKTQYYLTVSSDYGYPEGEGWYDKGSTAWTGTAEQIISADGTRYIFLNWTIDGIDQTVNPVSIIMDAPHTAVTNYKTQYYLTVTSEYDAPAGEGWYDEGMTAWTGTAPAIVSDDGTRYLFLSWIVDGIDQTINPVSVIMDSPHTAVTNYKTQYYLTVESAYGDPQGAGWYDSGSAFEISVTSPVGTIIRQVFTGWSGYSTATTPTATVLMDGPKTVIANWRTDYLYLYILIGGVLGLAGVVSASVILIRRRRKEPLEEV